MTIFDSSSERKFGVILTYINICASTFIMLFYTPFVIRCLGQSEFGLYSLALSIINYLVILDFGLGNAIIVFTSKFLAKNEIEKQKTLYGTVFGMYLMMSLFAVIAGVYFYNNIELFFLDSMSEPEIKTLKTLILILVFNVAISLPCNIFVSILNAYEKFIFIRLMGILRTLLMPCFLTIVLLLGYKSIAMILTITCLNVVYFLTTIIYYKKHINISINVFKFKFNALKIVLSYSVFIFIAIVVDQINWNTGQFIIGAFLGAKEISVFAIAILINTMFMMLSTAVSGVFLPKISQMVANSATNQTLTNEMIRIGRLQQYIIFLILFGFILFGKEFISVWAGKDYADAYYLTIIIMIPLAVPLIQNLGLSILQAKNKYAFKSISALIVAVLSIILSRYLVEIYGYYGVSFSISLSFFILNGVIINWYYHSKIGLDMFKFWKEIIKNIFPEFLLFMLFLILINLANLNGLIYLVLGIFIFALLYIYICYKFCMNESEKSLLNPVMNKFKRTKI